MRLMFSSNGWDDYLWWQAQDNPKLLGRVNDLIESARRTPFQGIGKPEGLKGNLKGHWSRRITEEHRIVYSISGKGNEQTLQIVALRYHYE